MQIGLGLSLSLSPILGGTIGSGLVDAHPLYAYTRPTFLTDFLTGWYELSGTKVSAFSSLPSISIARASTGYAQTAAGVLTSFASGAARITDKGLLVEGAATNLCLWSQEFDNATWSNPNITVTANAGVAPDGTATADLCTVTTTAATQLVQAVGAVVGTNCCASVYVQNVNRTDSVGSFYLRDLTAAAIKVTCTVNWDAMTVSGTGARIERLGSSNWYRIIMVDTAWTTGNTAQIYCGAAGASLTGGMAWYQWGAQLEAAAYASSYIPTTTASATRAADVISLPVSGLAYPVTMYAEVDFPTLKNSGASSAFLQVDDGDSSDRALLYSTAGAGTGARMYVAAASVQQALPSVGTLAVGVSKMAARCAANSFQVAGGGTLATEDASGSAPSTPTTIRFGRETSGGTEAAAYLRRLAIWPTAFSNAQLQAVTT